MSGIISAHNGWSLRRCARCSCPAAFLLPRLPEPIGFPRWKHWSKLQEQIDLFFRRFDHCNRCIYSFTWKKTSAKTKNQVVVVVVVVVDPFDVHKLDNIHSPQVHSTTLQCCVFYCQVNKIMGSLQHHTESQVQFVRSLYFGKNDKFTQRIKRANNVGNVWDCMAVSIQCTTIYDNVKHNVWQQKSHTPRKWNNHMLSRNTTTHTFVHNSHSRMWLQDLSCIVYKQNPTKNVFAKKNRHTHKSKWNERIQHEHRIARANRHCWIKVVMGCLSFVFSGVLKLNWRKIKSKPWVIIYVQTVIRWSCRTLWCRWIRTMLRIGNGIVQPTRFFHWWREPYSSRALC